MKIHFVKNPKRYDTYVYVKALWSSITNKIDFSFV